MSNKLLKCGNPARAPQRCLEKMNAGNCEYLTWENNWSADRFIARKSFVEKLAQDKRYRALEGEVVKLGTNLTVDELLFELDANNCDELEIKEGLTKENRTISRHELNVISEVLYNIEFDFSIFWPRDGKQSIKKIKC